MFILRVLRESALCHVKGLFENMEAFSKTATNMPELMQSPCIFQPCNSITSPRKTRHDRQDFADTTNANVQIKLERNVFSRGKDSTEKKLRSKQL